MGSKFQPSTQPNELANGFTTQLKGPPPPPFPSKSYWVNLIVYGIPNKVCNARGNLLSC